MNKSILAICLVTSLLLPGLVRGTDLPLYRQPSAPLNQRVNDLFKRLTENEKLSLLGGTGFTTQPIPRLGVPAMAMADGPLGVRGGQQSTLGPATAFPAGVLMASTWDTNLLRQIGQALGVEAHNKGTGVQIILGPGVNIHRSPLGGRNGEFFSEDPYLTAQLAVSYIRGVQSTGVSACVKHFVCNNQETDRGNVSANVSERALREIYLPAFKAAVQQGHVWSVMSSYNRINGIHATANHYLLTDVLKKQWGFTGMVMSDWGAVHQTDVVQAGNDLEMPTGKYMSVPKLKAALAKGTVTQAAVDDSVRRILRTIIRVGLLNGPMHPDNSLVNTPAHDRLALETAEQGIVLLKNENHLLPLDCAKLHSIAVIGQDAKHIQIDALGSPKVEPPHVVELLAGIKARAHGVKIYYAPGQTRGEPLPLSAITVPGNPTEHGFRAEYFKNRNLQGKPALVRVEPSIKLQSPQRPAPNFPAVNFSVRWTTRLVPPATGRYHFTFTGDDGFRVYLNGKLLINNWIQEGTTPATSSAELQAGKAYRLRIEYFQAGGGYVARFNWQPPQTRPYEKAIAAAKKADVVILAASTDREEGEGHDRPSMALPHDQADLIRAVAAANPHTIVVLNNGTPVTMNTWLKKVPAVLETWFPGQDGGTAIAAILFGDVNPSGKLPDTLAVHRSDYPDAGHFPGHNHEVDYAEGIFVGYRHFDKAGIKPLFPFGYGLSYTTFGYHHLKLSSLQLSPDGSLTASVNITNTGKRPGAEVVELYLHTMHPQVDRPVRVLKGFAKVKLQPGQTKTVHFSIVPQDLAYFDVPGNQWKANPGEYQVQIGASSRDIRQKAVFRLTKVYTKKVLPAN